MCVVVSAMLGAGLHLSVYVGAPGGVIQEEAQHTGLHGVFFALVLDLPFLCGACLFFYREKGSAVSCSLIDREVEFLCTHDEVALHCWVLLGKKPQITPRFKPTTQPSEGHEVRVTATGATGLAITARGVLTTRDYWARLLSALAHPLIDYTINTTCGITALVCVDEILL